MTVTFEESWDLEGTYDLNLKSTDVSDPTRSYYGVVVPVDNNNNIGTHSKEFCFNFADQKYGFGDECSTFD